MKQEFWIRWSLFYLCLAALIGFTLRSKMLFSIPFLDYRNLLYAHAHLALFGWVGLALIVLLIRNLLPPQAQKKAAYRAVCTTIAICAPAMAVAFLSGGYSWLSILLLGIYLLATYVFALQFTRDLRRNPVHPSVRLLGSGAAISLALSSLGTIVLAGILVLKSGHSLLYRDAHYTFLHFQYNGFFTLAVFALVLQHLLHRGIALSGAWRRFAVLLTWSTLPTLALSLLWHGYVSFYIIALAGALMLLYATTILLTSGYPLDRRNLHHDGMARILWTLALASFVVKVFMQTGTLIPSLGHAIYADRPVIIGFLHLVFLAFASFYILSFLIEHGAFKKRWYPFAIFAVGVLSTEGFLLIQGLGILLRTNSASYNWLLWCSAALLVAGAVLIFFHLDKTKKS